MTMERFERVQIVCMFIQCVPFQFMFLKFPGIGFLHQKCLNLVCTCTVIVKGEQERGN